MKIDKLDDQFSWYLPYYSQFGQDKYLNEEVFRNKTNGVFVEIGAYDGIKLSNTYFFEKEMNWSGICVEPVPPLFSKAKENRRCLCINKGIADVAKTFKFLHVIGGDQYGIIEDGAYPKIKGREHTEMLSGLVEFHDPYHLNIIQKELVELGGSKELLEVECIPINELLQMLPTNKIDYLSIDTEGSEFRILQTLDFSFYDIDVIGFEVLTPRKEIPTFMEKNGYKLINNLGYDHIYKKV